MDNCMVEQSPTIKEGKEKNVDALYELWDYTIDAEEKMISYLEQNGITGDKLITFSRLLHIRDQRLMDYSDQFKMS